MPQIEREREKIKMKRKENRTKYIEREYTGSRFSVHDTDNLVGKNRPTGPAQKRRLFYFFFFFPGSCVRETYKSFGFVLLNDCL